MSKDQTVPDNYLHGNLLKSIENALPALGKTIDSVTIEDLSPVDEFHIGGRIATDHLMEKLDFSADDHLLDVGCGLGGAARYVATHYECFVSGIDLTPEYIETGRALSHWFNLEKFITLEHGSALSMPFKNSTFDSGYMLHVGMNIADKQALYAEIHRVLKEGASFGIYDIMRQTKGELTYPVPWTKNASDCHLSSLQEYKKALNAVGLECKSENVRSEFALDFFNNLKAKMSKSGGPPPLGLHVLMQESAAIKVKNMISNIERGLIAPVELIVYKP